MIRIAHASDTHDKPAIVKAVANVDCDVIVLSGDILANKGRCLATGGEILPHAERKYQTSWFRKVAKAWAPAFAGRPVVYVPGNHDFIGIERWLAHYGHTNVHTISAETPFADVCGKRFAGFREIPYMEGEWMGECRDFQPLIQRAFGCNPDILVTHAPASGILSVQGDYGVPALTSALFYGTHNVTHHLFGHDHHAGGRMTSEGGIVFSNAAGNLNIIEVP